MALAWYVARTNPRAEFLVQDQLENKGFEYFLPVVSTLSPRPGRADAPLFPSYLFLRYDVESPESTSIRTIPGLTGLVNFDGVTPAVPDEVIGSLRQTVADMNEGGGLTSKFWPGEQVWIRWGPGDTEDLAKVVSDTKSPRGRGQVLIEFLGRLVSGEVSRANIRPVHETEALEIEGQKRSRRRTRGKGRFVFGAAPRPTHNGFSSS